MAWFTFLRSPKRQLHCEIWHFYLNLQRLYMQVLVLIIVRHWSVSHIDKVCLFGSRSQHYHKLRLRFCWASHFLSVWNAHVKFNRPLAHGPVSASICLRKWLTLSNNKVCPAGSQGLMRLLLNYWFSGENVSVFISHSTKVYACDVKLKRCPFVV